MRKLLIAAPLIAGFVAVLAGCGKTPEVPPQAKPQTPETAAEHAHKEGAHKGVIVEIGRDNYHAEAVFEKDGVIRLYTLGKDESVVLEVDAQTVDAYVKPDGGMEATAVPFEADPQRGDSPGKTTRFTARLPMEHWGKAVAVTVPSIRVAGQRFRFAFNSPADAAHDAGLDKVTGDAEKLLYQTPAGKYTTADIKANGAATPSEKFKGVVSAHNMKPGPGDKVCPITRTKANPKFAWVIDGKTYEFCCPPCIDEFVQMAKDNPNAIQEPESYRKK